MSSNLYENMIPRGFWECDNRSSLMPPTRGNARWCFITRFVVLLIGLASIGCDQRRLRPVNVEIARSTLSTVLDHWKDGGTIDELRQNKPEIVAQEALWSNGNELISYEILEDGRAEDANWYCEAELTLRMKDSDTQVKKKVTYVVGTHPVLTVFHAIL